MPDLQIYPIERFAQSSAAIKRPQELTYFSYDNEHVQYHDARSLQYYYPPELGSFLSEGFETFRKIDDTDDEHLDGLLSSIVQYEQRGLKRKREVAEEDANKERFNDLEDASKDETTAGNNEDAVPNENRRVDADFITWRGMMTKIMTAPYTDFDGFEMNATVFQGTIFIEESHEAKLASRSKQEAQRPRRGMPDQELMSYWGHKFETLSLLPDTWGKTSRSFIDSRSSHVTSNYSQFVSVAQTGIGDLKLVIGGEVDGIWDEHPSLFSESLSASPSSVPPLLSPSQLNDLTSSIRPSYVELKTSAEHPSNPTQKDIERFERKLLKFWAQSFLLGVPKIIVGFRTNNMEGRLVRVQEFTTTGIPKIVREGGGGSQGRPSWQMGVCVNFAGEFLNLLKNTITSSNTADATSGGVWRIRRTPRASTINIDKVEESGHGDILSQEFITWRTTGDALQARKAGMLDRWGVKMARRARASAADEDGMSGAY